MIDYKVPEDIKKLRDVYDNLVDKTFYIIAYKPNTDIIIGYQEMSGTLLSKRAIYKNEYFVKDITVRKFSTAVITNKLLFSKIFDNKEEAIEYANELNKESKKNCEEE